MNIDSNKLKTLLKPLVKSLIKECLLEEGVLSSIISETLIGFKKADLLNENMPNLKQNVITQNKPMPKRQNIGEDFKQMMNENREKTTQEILNKTGLKKVFENLQPSIEQKTNLTTENAQKSPESFQAAANKSGTALRNIPPNDPGININGILKLIGGKETWKSKLN